MPIVSIVLLNWRSYPIILEAAETAAAQLDVEVELIIVDNDSNDGSLPELKRRFPQARFVEMGVNAGFAAGMNAGVAVATGEFVLLQNADLVLALDHCALAVAAMRKDPSLGAAGGKVNRLVDGRRSDTLDGCGYMLDGRFRGVKVQPDRGGIVMGVSGTSPFLRATAIADVSRPVGYLFDPWYFAYFEDIDLMLRLNLAGWRVRYVPELRAWHLRSHSTGGSTRFYARTGWTLQHTLKNRLATIVKDCPRALLWRLGPSLVITELLLPFYLLLRRPSGLPVLARAWRIAWNDRKRLLAERGAIQRQAVEKQAVSRFDALVGSASKALTD